MPTSTASSSWCRIHRSASLSPTYTRTPADREPLKQKALMVMSSARTASCPLPQIASNREERTKNASHAMPSKRALHMRQVGLIKRSRTGETCEAASSWSGPLPATNEDVQGGTRKIRRDRNSSLDCRPVGGHAAACHVACAFHEVQLRVQPKVYCAGSAGARSTPSKMMVVDGDQSSTKTAEAENASSPQELARELLVEMKREQARSQLRSQFFQDLTETNEVLLACPCGRACKLQPHSPPPPLPSSSSSSRAPGTQISTLFCVQTAPVNGVAGTWRALQRRQRAPHT